GPPSPLPCPTCSRRPPSASVPACSLSPLPRAPGVVARRVASPIGYQPRLAPMPLLVPPEATVAFKRQPAPPRALPLAPPSPPPPSPSRCAPPPLPVLSLGTAVVSSPLSCAAACLRAAASRRCSRAWRRCAHWLAPVRAAHAWALSIAALTACRRALAVRLVAARRARVCAAPRARSRAAGVFAPLGRGL